MKVGVVGCGRIGARHLEAYAELGGVELVVADADAEQAKRLAEQWDVRPVAPEALFEEHLDGLDVCLPSALHKEWIVAALDAGVHVFCEKPLCLSYAEATEIRDTALRAQRNVVVGYLYRHHPAFRFARETIAHGVIGDPYFALARLGGRGSHRSWKHDASRGGGVLFEMMVHLLDLLSWLLGPLTDGRLVYRDLLLPTRTIDGELAHASADDCAVVTVSAGGVRSVCQSDLATPSFMNYVEVQGGNGSLMASILDFVPTVVYCNEPRVLFDRGHNFRTFGPTNLFVKELASFLETIGSDELTQWSLLESVELARFLDAIREGERDPS